MKERILLAGGVNGTELLRSLARFGKGQLGLRIMSPVELAEYALMRSGVILRESFLSKNEETALFRVLLEGNDYFSSSCADAEKFAASVDSLRLCIPDQERETLALSLSKGSFRKKNEALLKLFDRYAEACRERSLLDGVELLRKALALAAPFEAEFYSLKEFPPAPLERRLLEFLSGGGCREISLPELFGRQPAEADYASIVSAYGRSNEVENVLASIYERGWPLDRCAVAAVSPSEYAQLFYEYALSRGIPMNFGCGLPILNANPARLLKLYAFWSGHGYFGTDALKAMVYSECFDRAQLSEDLEPLPKGGLDALLDCAGALKLSASAEENGKKLSAFRAVADEEQRPMLDCCERLSVRLSMTCGDFIARYAVIREEHPGRVDRSALNVIRRELEAFGTFCPDGRPEEILPVIFSKTVCSENSREGALYVTSPSGALSSMREHLFVVGLSSGNFPGSPEENFLVLDEDYLALGEDVPTSSRKILQKKQQLEDLLSLAASLGVGAELSYSSYDAADLKEDNPSSVLFEYFRKKHGGKASMEEFEASIAEKGFFARALSVNDAIGRAYAAGEVCRAPLTDPIDQVAIPPEQTLSATAAEKLAECPRKFFLMKKLRMEEAEENDPFLVIDPLTLGNLVHAQMETLQGVRPPREDFLKSAGERFDAYLAGCPPIDPKEGEKEKKNFLRMAGHGFDMDDGFEVLLTEQDLFADHPSGIRLQAKPDRVERLPDGSCKIVDYKSGRKIRHLQDDVDSCLQILIYAYVMEQNGIPVSSCEYRYLREGIPVTCRYDGEMRERLGEKLAELEEILASGVFSRTSDDSSCRFCPFKGLCGRKG